MNQNRSEVVAAGEPWELRVRICDECGHEDDLKGDRHPEPESDDLPPSVLVSRLTEELSDGGP